MSRRLTFINLRKEIETLRDHVGFRWVALRSASLLDKCSECTKQIGANYDQPSPSCTVCLGTGYAYVDKLVKGFRYLGSPGFDFKTNIGIVNTESQVYILEFNKEPKTTDFIMELEMNETTLIPKQPFNVTRIFKIQNAFPLRGDKGRIEFWRCFIEERNMAKSGNKSII